MLTFYYTRNLLPCWIMIYYSKQFNYAYPIYALHTGFFFKLLNLFHFLELKVHWGLKLYEQVVNLRYFWCLICNVTIKPYCYKIGQIISKNPVIFFNLIFMAVIMVIVQISYLTQIVLFIKKALKITHSSMNCLRSVPLNLSIL